LREAINTNNTPILGVIGCLLLASLPFSVISSSPTSASSSEEPGKVLIIPEDALYVDLTRDPPAFYTAENISLAGISEPHRDELLRIANMTETERLEYLDRTLN